MAAATAFYSGGQNGVDKPEKKSKSSGSKSRASDYIDSEMGFGVSAGTTTTMTSSGAGAMGGVWGAIAVVAAPYVWDDVVKPIFDWINPANCQESQARVIPDSRRVHPQSRAVPSSAMPQPKTPGNWEPPKKGKQSKKAEKQKIDLDKKTDPREGTKAGTEPPRQLPENRTPHPATNLSPNATKLQIVIRFLGGLLGL